MFAVEKFISPLIHNIFVCVLLIHYMYIQHRTFLAIDYLLHVDGAKNIYLKILQTHNWMVVLLLKGNLVASSCIQAQKKTAPVLHASLWMGRPYVHEVSSMVVSFSDQPQIPVKTGRLREIKYWYHLLPKVGSPSRESLWPQGSLVRGPLYY